MKARVAELVKNADVIDSKGQTDTIRLWENYREQASLWRAIALLQVPMSCVALIFALIMWSNRVQNLIVPPSPEPGTHQVQKIPDSYFIDEAQNFVNLIATFTPSVVQRQYEAAERHLVNPLLDKFKREFMINEIQTISSTNRTQLFSIDPTKTTVNREGPQVIVSFTGDRVKSIAGRELEPIETRYSVSLVTIPRNELNPFGIVVRDLDIVNTKAEQIELRMEKKEREQQRAQQRR